MNHLRHMSIFAHIVECGSITAAADALDLSKSVVSQHLKLLEDELGVTLIKRSTRKHALTNAGSEFYEYCKEINNLAGIAWQQAQDSTQVAQGSIRITASNALMDIIVAPAIGDIMHQHPLLEPELISEDMHSELLEENIDLAIRVGESTISNLRQRRIGTFRDVLCGSELLLSNTKAAKGIPYIANTWQGNQIRHELKNSQGKIQVYETDVHCKSNSFHSCLALINSGAGVGIIPDFHFAHSEKKLVEVFPDYQLPLNPVYAMHTYNKRVPLNLSICLDAIEEKLNSLMVK